MLPCKEIVRILSSQEEPSKQLSWSRRAELRLHLMMCKHCSRYATHLDMMRAGFKKLFAKTTEVSRAQVMHLENEVIDNLKRKVSK